MTEERKLTKKERKALAFRANKGKGKGGNNSQDALQPEVPLQEDLTEEDITITTPITNNKRKRTAEEEEDPTPTTGTDQLLDPPKKKKRQRGGMNKPKISPGQDNEGKPKLVLFIGNLPFKVTVEQIKHHFAPTGESPAVRLLTPKQSSVSATPSVQSKGCAFIQFTLPLALQAALRLHESTLGGRKINVELTAGGGGNGAERKAKLQAKRKHLGEEREKVARNKRVREGKPADPEDKAARWGLGSTPAAAAAPSTTTTEAPTPDGGKPATQKKEILLPSGQVKKVRDRRIPKTDASGVEKERARKLQAKAAAASSGANSIKLGA